MAQTRKREDDAKPERARDKERADERETPGSRSVVGDKALDEVLKRAESWGLIRHKRASGSEGDTGLKRDDLRRGK